MSLQADIQGAGSRNYHDVAGRRDVAPRAGYILTVSGVLAIVTFTLVYLTTLSYATGF